MHAETHDEFPCNMVMADLATMEGLRMGLMKALWEVCRFRRLVSRSRADMKERDFLSILSRVSNRGT
jgi:hypothetical protein